FPFNRPALDGEEQTASIRRPAQVLLNRFVGVGRDGPGLLNARERQVHQEDVVLLRRLHARGDGVGDECEASGVGRDLHLAYFQWSVRYNHRARSGAGLLLFFLLFFVSRRRLLLAGVSAVGERDGELETSNGITPLGRAVLNNVLPFFLVRVALGFAPRLASGEVDGA